MWTRSGLVVMATCALAHAQQLPCEPCVRGDDALAQLGPEGQALRVHGRELVSVGVVPGGTIERPQLARLRALLGDDYDALADKLAPLSDTTRADLAAAVCSAPGDHCQVTLAAALACIAGRCQVRDVEVEHLDMHMPPPCDPTVKHVRSPAFGLGLEVADGRQDDRSPVDGRAWSVGIEARARLHDRFGVVGRVDRSTGRDAAVDQNGDGRDDVSTGPVTRVSVLAGPSMMFGIRHGDATRFAQLDLLGGYEWTLSQDRENGPAAGADLSYSLEVARVGLRVTQGFGDARDARAALAHVGFVIGAGPSFSYGYGCGRDEDKPSSPIALALDIPLFGYGLSSALDYSVPGFGLEAALHASKLFDVLGRADLLVFPNGDRDRALYHSVLSGIRLDLLDRKDSSSARTGFFTALMWGYAWASTVEPTAAGSGPVVDASVGWGGEGDDGMAYFRLHGRFGVTPDNYDMRAVFVSAGVELRLDRRRWRDRN